MFRMKARAAMRPGTVVIKRFQSSSKKNLNLNSLNPVLPKINNNSKEKDGKKMTGSVSGNEKEGDNNSGLKSSTTTNTNSNETTNKLIETKVVKPKIGFSSLPKVASTYNFNPKDLLLDSFFNGYRPMTLPITPQAPKKTILPRLHAALSKQSPGGAFVYFEIDDNLDFIEGLKDELDPDMSHTVQDIERQTSTRFDHSHKSLKEEDLKKEQYERELYETKLVLAKEEDLTNDFNPSNIVESKRFRGRRKLEYKKKGKK